MRSIFKTLGAEVEKNNDSPNQIWAWICLKVKLELYFIGISFLIFGKTPVNITHNFHHTAASVPVEPFKVKRDNAR